MFCALRRRLLSTTTTKEWVRPLGEGVIPAYDASLSIIEKDSQTQKEEIARLLQKQEERGLTETEVVNLRKLEITSDINRPQIRWNFKNGQWDMSKPVYRHLAEVQWREKGRLDLLMQRVHTMNVIPDLLPEIHPSLDLGVRFPTQATHEKPTMEEVEPGVILNPQQTMKPPQLRVMAFHPEERLYTLVLVDPDVPDTLNQSFKSYLHWLQPNIAISALTTDIILPKHCNLPYIPPHPQKGSPSHRYVLLLLPNLHPTTPINLPLPATEERLGFDLRSFVQTHGFQSQRGGAIHFWRENWAPFVSEIYQSILKLPEPRYGLPPKPDRYAELKRQKKYAL